MKVMEFLKMMWKPIIIFSVMISVVTLIAYFNTLPSKNLTGWQLFLWAFNSHSGNNPAKWFKSVLYLLCSLSFFLISRNSSKSPGLSQLSKIHLKLVSIILCLFSGEVMFSIHTKIDLRVINVLGVFSSSFIKDSKFYWLLFILVPAGIIGIVVLLAILHKYLTLLPDSEKHTKRARLLLILAFLSIPGSILFEGIQGYSVVQGTGKNIFPYFEEVLELLGLCCFIGFNMYISKAYDL